MLADTQRFENFYKEMVPNHGDQTALSKSLKHRGYDLSQQEISEMKSSGIMSSLVARRIEKSYGLPRKFLDVVSLEELKKRGFTLCFFLKMEEESRAIVKGLLEVIVEEKLQ